MNFKYIRCHYLSVYSWVDLGFLFLFYFNFFSFFFKCTLQKLIENIHDLKKQSNWYVYLSSENESCCLQKRKFLSSEMKVLIASFGRWRWQWKKGTKKKLLYYPTYIKGTQSFFLITYIYVGKNFIKYFCNL